MKQATKKTKNVKARITRALAVHFPQYFLPGHKSSATICEIISISIPLCLADLQTTDVFCLGCLQLQVACAAGLNYTDEFLIKQVGAVSV